MQVPKVEMHEPNAPFTPKPFVWRDPKTIPPRQWLYRPHYIRGFLSVTLAAGGTSKSTLTMIEAFAMATGRPLLGIPVKEPLRVWYFNLEDPMDELERRAAAICKHFNITREEISDRLFINSGRPPETPLIIAKEDRLGAAVIDFNVTRITDEIRDRKIDVMILDPFAGSHEVNENDNSKVNMVATAWSTIAEAANCSIMLVHHTRKTGGVAGTAEDGRGASALVYAARSVRNLNTMTEKEAGDADIDESLRGFYFRTDLGKQNLLPPAEHADWFERVSVDMENGGDTVGVVKPFLYPQAGDQRASGADVRKILARIKDGGPWRKSEQSSDEPWVGEAVAEVLGLDLASKQARKRVRAVLKPLYKDLAIIEERRPDANGDERPYVVIGPNAAPTGGAGTETPM